MKRFQGKNRFQIYDIEILVVRKLLGSNSFKKMLEYLCQLFMKNYIQQDRFRKKAYKVIIFLLTCNKIFNLKIQFIFCLSQFYVLD